MNFYSVTAVGQRDLLQDNCVFVPDLENASVTVFFDRISGCVLDVAFDGRPQAASHMILCLTAGISIPEIKNRETEEVCHRISIVWMKAQTKRDVLGKDLFVMNQEAMDQRNAIANSFGDERLLPPPPRHVEDEIDDIDILMGTYLEHESYAVEFERRSEGVFDQLSPEEQFGFFFPEQDPDLLMRLQRIPGKKQQCLHTARSVAMLYVNRCKVLSNMFVGSKEHNRVAGALAYVLHKYVAGGQERYKVPFTIFLDVGREASQKKAACFNMVKKWLNTNAIVIDTWDMLLDLYFSCNYDESSSRSTGSLCNAKKMFLYTVDKPL